MNLEGVCVFEEFGTTDRMHHMEETDIAACVSFFYSVVREAVEMVLMNTWSPLIGIRKSGVGALNKLVASVDFISIKIQRWTVGEIFYF